MKDNQELFSKISKHKLFTNQLSNLITSLLEVNGVKYHIIESRTKEVNSLNEKLSRKKVTNINEVTDLSGLRIILYYQDDVDIIEKLIRDNFIVDDKNSVNKADLYKANEFGYLSVHFIISIDKSRYNLPEWKNSKDLKAEIQVRTVLQHSWASISHELSYKKSYEIPTELERKLFRLAGLFELADEEFLSIRNKHSNLLNRIKKADSDNELIDEEINKLTIYYLFTEGKNDIIKYIEETAIEAGFSKDDDESTSFNSAVIQITKILKITKIRDLIEILEKNKGYYLDYFSSIFLKNPLQKMWLGNTSFYIGLSLMYEFNEEQLKYYLKNGNYWSKEPLEKVTSSIIELKNYN